jgi:DNA mismatch endonuclease, patch repair protein
MDRLTPEQRSAVMRSVKTKNTTPEIAVRKMLFAAGYRFRLHRRDLPGSPDIVLPARRAVVFVNGCFWHAHQCRRGLAPETRTEFWNLKRAGNVRRDARNRRSLRRLGWRTVVVWECQLRKDYAIVLRRLMRFLDPMVRHRSTKKLLR